MITIIIGYIIGFVVVVLAATYLYIQRKNERSKLKEVKEYRDEEETILSEHYFLKNRKLEGVYKYWHRNGQLFEQCSFKDGNLDGEYKHWHSNGQLCTRCFYKNGNLDGEYKRWYEDGKLCHHWYYKNGVKYICYGDRACTNCSYNDCEKRKCASQLECKSE